jgi:hypothetical protein
MVLAYHTSSERGICHLRQTPNELVCICILTRLLDKRHFDFFGSELMGGADKSILDVLVNRVVEEKRFLLD